MCRFGNYKCLHLTVRRAYGCRSGIIKPGDVIAKIDAVPLAGETVARLTQLMLGPPGSFVEITLHRGAQTICVSLVRSPSKLTPLQVNQQREAQNAAQTGGAGRRGVGREKSTMSRFTDNSFVVSQSSYVSSDDDHYRELGGELSWDPDALAAQPSMVASEASFDPERMVFDQMSEKSFDPEAIGLNDNGDLMSERSFDPELLVQMSEKSFDPELFDPDARSIASEKSFDPEMMGFMSEKSFDPEMMGVMSEESLDADSVDALRQMSLMSQKSFDPELIDLDDLRSPDSSVSLRAFCLRYYSRATRGQRGRLVFVKHSIHMIPCALSACIKPTFVTQKWHA